MNNYKKIILLVEDNEDDVILTLQALKNNNIGNEIIVVRDGAEALDFLFGTGKYRERDIYQLPQVVLLDINLPKVNGLQVLEKIRSNAITRLLPVIILTSSKEERDMIKSNSLGANSFIRKPLDFEQFIDAVRQLSLYWLVLNEFPGYVPPNSDHWYS